MNNFLPSKKFTLTLISIALAVLVIWFGSYMIKRQKSEPTNLSEVEKKQHVEFLSKDSDGDGLMDWEESLWKTDSRKNDSDADGTNDGDEIAVNRNPLVANQAKAGQAPTDAVSQEIIDKQKEAEETFKSLTETEKLSRLILSQYLAVKESGNLDAASKNYIINNSISSNLTNYSLPLNKTSIIIIPQNSNENIKTYFNSLSATLRSDEERKIPHETSVLATAISDEDPSVLNQLEKNIAIYNGIVEKLKKIPVPQILSDLHLAIINDFVRIKKDVGDMKFIFSDSLITIYALENYKNNVEALNKKMIEMKNFMVAKKITLERSDPGYIFFNVVK